MDAISKLVGSRLILRGEHSSRVEAVQKRLRAHGHELAIDGDFGEITEEAVKRFQIAHGLTSDGKVGKQTAVALDQQPERPTEDRPPLPSVLSVAPWLARMRALTGTREISGRQSNPLILQMRDDIVARFPDLKGTVGWYSNDDTPWCGLAVAACVANSGFRPPPAPLGAVNWFNDWPDGRHLSGPALGAILVKTRKGGGHVTLYEGENENYYFCRGGNQSDMVNVSAIAKSSGVLGFTWPKDAPGPVGGQVHTSFANAVAGGSEA